MTSLEMLATRLRTTGEIHSIVRTMKSLSSASIRQYERAAEAIAEYERTIDLGLQVVLRDSDVRARLLSEAAGRVDGADRPRALIVVGSDRGLCGPFNDRIGDFALLHSGANGAQPVERVCAIGQRVAGHLEAAGRAPDARFSLPGSAVGLIAAVRTVAVEIEAWSRSEAVGQVSLAFNRRAGTVLAQPVLWPLLPLQKGRLLRLAHAPWPSRGLPFYRMDRARLMFWLIGQHIFVQLYRALAESLASEHASRLAATQRAERNITEQREALTRAFQQERQEAITRELIDILSGFEAVRGRADA